MVAALPFRVVRVRGATPKIPDSFVRMKRSLLEGGDPRRRLHDHLRSRPTTMARELYDPSGCRLSNGFLVRRFLHRDLEHFMSDLFEAIVDADGVPGPPIELSRFDLFHAHLVVGQGPGAGPSSSVKGEEEALFLIFHAREYPKYCEDNFPINLGFCQVGSNLEVDMHQDMNHRNFLFISRIREEGGSLWLVDLGGHEHPENVVYGLGTIDESSFGTPLATIMCFSKDKMRRSHRMRRRGRAQRRKIMVEPFQTDLCE